MSKQYENDLCAAIWRATGDDVKVYRCGYSGSNVAPQPDILVTTPYEKHGLEVKKASQKYCRIDKDDIAQLTECVGPNTGVYLVIKFTHREPVVVRYFDGAFGHAGDGKFSDQTPQEKFVELFPDAFDPRVTDGGALALTRPSTDEWPSSQSGREDHVAILSGLGIENESSMVE